MCIYLLLLRARVASIYFVCDIGNVFLTCFCIKYLYDLAHLFIFIAAARLSAKEVVGRVGSGDYENNAYRNIKCVSSYSSTLDPFVLNWNKNLVPKFKVGLFQSDNINHGWAKIVKCRLPDQEFAHLELPTTTKKWQPHSNLIFQRFLNALPPSSCWVCVCVCDMWHDHFHGRQDTAAL